MQVNVNMNFNKDDYLDMKIEKTIKKKKSKQIWKAEIQKNRKVCP